MRGITGIPGLKAGEDVKPSLVATLSTRVLGGPHDGYRRPRISLELKQVRLERARAIELGFATPEEAYDTV